MVRQRRWRQAEDSMVPSTNKDLPTQRFKQIWLDVIHQVLGWVAPVFGLLIVLVDQSECFVFKPMLYELLSGEVDKWEIAPPFSDLLANTSVQFFKDRVKVLNPSDHWGMNGSKASSCGGTVHLESGLLVEYDWLVLALGAESKLDVVPGAVEFAIPFSMLEDAPKVNDKLTKLERKTFGKDFQISVAVIGCGYSGVELAATLAE
ncbi:Alternative NAD(P)H-ubiquinone oxidoreductase C1, chloroplastic/mitochondrial isoform D [Glycine soja]|uniref:Alternative NAD(P)H-ubiquinone oxidoreductase C1, chloroplastic/mitochondrial isoform C n=1 Tax=Glycine soja TaxID=3848 RepID=A0A445J7R7_GLYSO|nr:Alternative NAD(P)H-ubiquinone oxidoreductase C1, chloroplastic/mitochondrial isoform C [Glycine soja]RZB94513.1 Alternative NAD(P)H-ubiquinone oxidoreductase C1, chloroplastic/mitochondrial isoform D [Glycine soja]